MANRTDAPFLRACADFAFRTARQIESDASHMQDAELRARLMKLANKYIDEGQAFERHAQSLTTSH